MHEVTPLLRDGSGFESRIGGLVNVCLRAGTSCCLTVSPYEPGMPWGGEALRFGGRSCVLFVFVYLRWQIASPALPSVMLLCDVPFGWVYIFQVSCL